MPDLSNPVVTVAYACGCSFTDDTETGGSARFRFGGDENRTFRLSLQLEGRSAAQKRALLNQELAKVTDTRKPTSTTLEQKATARDVYEALLERPAVDVVTETVEGVRFPKPPAHCPRHSEPAVHTHASYLNPADAKPVEELGEVVVGKGPRV